MRKNIKKALGYAYGGAVANWKNLSGTEKAGVITQGVGAAGNMVANALSGQKPTAAGVVSGAASGAATGFAIGGPWGAAIGGVLGGVTSGWGNTGDVDMSTGEINKPSGISGLWGHSMSYLRRRSNMVQNNNASRFATQQLQLAFMNNPYRENNAVAGVADGGIIPSTAAYLDDGELIRTPDGTIGAIPEEGKPTDSNLLNVPVGTQVLSDKLKVPGTNKTFAEMGKKLMKPTKGGNDKYAENSRMLNERNNQQAYQDLLNLLESMKIKKGKKKDDVPAYGDGSKGINVAGTMYGVGQIFTYKGKTYIVTGRNAATEVSAQPTQNVPSTSNNTSANDAWSWHPLNVPVFSPELAAQPQKRSDNTNTPYTNWDFSSGPTYNEFGIMQNIPEMPFGAARDYFRGNTTINGSINIGDKAYGIGETFTMNGKVYRVIGDNSAAELGSEQEQDFLRNTSGMKYGSLGAFSVGGKQYSLGDTFELKGQMYKVVGNNVAKPVNREDNRTGVSSDFTQTPWGTQQIFDQLSQYTAKAVTTTPSSSASTDVSHRTKAIVKPAAQPIAELSLKHDVAKKEVYPHEAPVYNRNLVQPIPQTAKTLPQIPKQESEEVKTSNGFDWAGLLQPLASTAFNLLNREKPDRVETRTYSPAYGPATYDISDQLREINLNQAIANYNNNRNGVNTGASLAANIQSAVARNRAMADQYTTKRNKEAEMAFQNADIYNRWGEYTANAQHTADVEYAQNKAETKNMNRLSAQAILEDWQNYYKDVKQDRKDAALYQLLQPLLNYGTEDQAKAGFDAIYGGKKTVVKKSTKPATTKTKSVKTKSSKAVKKPSITTAEEILKATIKPRQFHVAEK